VLYQPSLGSSTSKSQGSINRSHDSKAAVNAMLNDPSKSSQSRSMPSVGTGAGQIFTDIGLYKGVVISIKHIKKDHVQITRQVLLEFNEVSASLWPRSPAMLAAGHYVLPLSLVSLFFAT